MVDEKILERAEVEVARRVEIEVVVEDGIIKKEIIEGNVENVRKIIVKEKRKENEEGKTYFDDGENGVEVGKKIHTNRIKEKENILIVKKFVSAKSVKAEEIIETKTFKPNFNEESANRTKILYENNEKKFLHERNEDKIDQDYFRIDNDNNNNNIENNNNNNYNSNNSNNNNNNNNNNSNNNILLNNQRKEREENEFKNHYLDLFPIMS